MAPDRDEAASGHLSTKVEGYNMSSNLVWMEKQWERGGGDMELKGPHQTGAVSQATLLGWYITMLLVIAGKRIQIHSTPYTTSYHFSISILSGVERLKPSSIVGIG